MQVPSTIACEITNRAYRKSKSVDWGTVLQNRESKKVSFNITPSWNQKKHLDRAQKAKLAEQVSQQVAAIKLQAHRRYRKSFDYSLIAPSLHEMRDAAMESFEI